jgi:hypothetical protein
MRIKSAAIDDNISKIAGLLIRADELSSPPLDNFDDAAGESVVRGLSLILTVSRFAASSVFVFGMKMSSERSVAVESSGVTNPNPAAALRNTPTTSLDCGFGDFPFSVAAGVV